jgi:hypothetical protein
LITAGKYLPLGRLVLAVVLIAASSGFTVVLHSCLMADMACCDTMAAGGTIGHPAGNSTAAAFVKGASSCCENTIVGGLNPTTATLENQSVSFHDKPVLAADTTDLPDGQAQGSSSFTTLRQFRPPDPPAIRLYLTNSALLI